MYGIEFDPYSSTFDYWSPLTPGSIDSMIEMLLTYEEVSVTELPNEVIRVEYMRPQSGTRTVLDFDGKMDYVPVARELYWKKKPTDDKATMLVGKSKVTWTDLNDDPEETDFRLTQVELKTFYIDTAWGSNTACRSELVFTYLWLPKHEWEASTVDFKALIEQNGEAWRPKLLGHFDKLRDEGEILTE